MRKFLSILLVFTMVLATALPCVLAAVPTLPDDIKGTTYQEEALLLSALKIFIGDADTGLMRPEDNIRRSEFAKIAVLLAGLEDKLVDASATPAFPDIVDGHWATSYINVSADEKIVIGDDCGNFRPDDDITLAEAVTVLSRILNYEQQSQNLGGFPDGYIDSALRNGLLRGITPDGASKATRGTIMKLSYSALTIAKMDKIDSPSGPIYRPGNSTILKDNLGVDKIEGTITANERTFFNRADRLKPGQLQITSGKNSVILTSKSADDQNLFGQIVTAYSRSGEIFLIRPSTKSKTLEITAHDLGEYEEKDDYNKLGSAKVSKTAPIIYNDVYNGLYWPEDQITQGIVKLLDQDGNGIYDMIFITEYTDHVVDGVEINYKEIVDKLSGKLLDFSDAARLYVTDSSNAILTLDDLDEFDIISVASSKDDKVVTITRSAKTIDGAITAIDGDLYTIGGKQYRLSDELARTMTFNLKDEGRFHLNFAGKITWFQGKNGIQRYAFLVDATPTDLKLFTQDGDTKTLKMAADVTLNGATAYPANTMRAILKTNANPDFSGLSPYAQLITYRLNENGEIDNIEVAYDNSDRMNEKKKTFSLDKIGTSLLYKSSTQKLDRYPMVGSTIVFDIPMNSQGTDTRNFSVKHADFFINNMAYNAEIYDVNFRLEPRVVIIKGGETNDISINPVAVVVKVTDTIYDGYPAKKLIAFYDGKKTEFIAKNAALVLKLQTGDVIQFSQDVRGLIDKVNILLPASSLSDMDSFGIFEREGSATEIAYGIIDDRFATSINVRTPNEIVNYSFTGAKIYEVATLLNEGDKVWAINSASLLKYNPDNPQSVFVRVQNQVVKEIILFNIPYNFEF